MAQLLDTDNVHDTPRRITNSQEVSMITPLTQWLAHVWAALAAVTVRDWLYYLLALPVVGVVAWFAVPGKEEEPND